MANPKRRHSMSRRDKRRTHFKLSLSSLSICPHCKQPKMPHRVCPNCGYYGQKQVVEISE